MGKRDKALVLAALSEVSSFTPFSPNKSPLSVIFRRFEWTSKSLRVQDTSDVRVSAFGASLLYRNFHFYESLIKECSIPSVFSPHAFSPLSRSQVPGPLGPSPLRFGRDVREKLAPL